MHYLLGIALMLTVLLILNLIGSALTTLLWLSISGKTKNFTSRSRERLLFILRASPLCAAFLIVFTLVLPGFLLYEPYSSKESITPQFAVITAVSLAGIIIAAFHLVGTWVATRRLETNWMASAEQISLDNVSIPAYRITHPFPVIAVVGVISPRMFVASQIFDSLSDSEIRSAIAHEYGHLTSHDNFKRVFLRVCRDMLVFPIGRQIDRAWNESREAAADEYAVQVGGNVMALDLASTLIKIARIVPDNNSSLMPLGSFVIEVTEGDVNSRVRRLITISDTNIDKDTATAGRTLGSWYLYSGIALLFALVPATGPDLLRSVHGISEMVVKVLQ